jgi:hypothetical protein
MHSRRVVGVVVSSAFSLMSLHVAPSQAAMVATAVSWPMTTAGDDHALSARLQALGVDPNVAHARIAALTPEERAQLGRLEQLPAGGDVLGAVAFSALVLLLTDILGYTDVYPFVTRTVNGEKTTSKLENCEPTAAAAIR